jgi:hypothetical protein
MPARHVALIVTLGLALLAFSAYMISQLDAPSWPIFLFCVLYIVVSVVMLERSRARLLERPLRKPRVVKVLFAAYAIGFGALLLCGLLALPVVGFAGFDLIGTKWQPVLLITGMLIGYPIASRWLK